LIKRLQFNVERLLLRGVHYRLTMAWVVIAFVAVTAGALVLLLDPGFERLASSVWWAFLRLSDPGYLGDDEGSVTRTVSTVVTVLGYVLFLGLLIAIMTQWMNDWIGKMESGRTSLEIKDHILILGWNHRTPSIVLELLRTKERATRFLQARKASDLRVVILAEDADATLRYTLRTGLGDYWDDKRVILRSGGSLHLDGLQRASFGTAATIILPGADFATARPGVDDAEVIKSLASISHHGGEATTKPLAVAALYNSKRSAAAHAAYGGRLEVVEADEIIARLLAQSALQPGLWEIYSELLTLNVGNALFVRTVPEGLRASFDELQRGCEQAALIGLIDAKSRTVLLNPGSEHLPSPGDQLVFIARRYDDCVVASADGEPGVEPTENRQEAQLMPAFDASRRILVLGWSRKVPLLVQQLVSYPEVALDIDLVGITPVEQRRRTVGDDTAAPTASVRHVEANFLDPDVLSDLEAARYDTIMLIARERMSDEAVADAATLSAYLTLGTIMQSAERPHVLAEVLEEENHPLFDTSRDDIMLSPLVVSYVLSQVALKPELGLVFNELAQASGTSIALRRIVSRTDDADSSFAELSAVARAAGELAIGLVSPNVNGGRVVLNPDRGLRWSPSADDRLVVLTDSVSSVGAPALLDSLPVTPPA
jgi:hypothetical protein